MNKRKDQDAASMELYKSIIGQIYSIISIIIAYFSAIALWYYNVGAGWSAGFTGRRTLFIVGVLYCITYWFFARMYRAHKIGLYRLTELAFSQTLAFAISDFVLLAAAFFWFHNFKRLHIFYFILALVIQVFLISVVIFVLNRLFARFDHPRRIIIIYGSEDYIYLVEKFKAVPYRYNIKYCCPDTTDWKTLTDTVGKCECVYLYETSNEIKDRMVLYCDQNDINIYTSIRIEDLITMGYEVSHSLDTPFIRNKKQEVVWYYPIVKRLFDIVSSLSALIILSPIMLITALCIHMYDKGPVFYKQVRQTKDGRNFNIIKFRSMIVDAEKHGARLASAGDSRITPVGRFIRSTRIDELPQLINILKGDMSIVGPRPERPELTEEYTKEIPQFPMRLKVKAGLTGYAQVYGKYNTTPEDKLKMDLLYINNRSIVSDFMIIFYTVKIIFMPESTEGVAEGQKTASKKKRDS